MARFGGTFLFALAVIAAAPPQDAAAAGAASPASDPSASERLARWSAARGGHLQLPLPGTPDTERPLARLQAVGASLGAPIIIRIFKAESELEVWVEKDGVYVPFATYPVCYWSGTLGPKLREGDRQTPEGFYTLTEEQLHHGGRWRRGLNIGYPNVFDRANARSGSAILVHGGCDSSGCFAMTNPVNAELYDLVAAALRMGQSHIPFHVFPFRMTEANVATHPTGPWQDFWDDLKQGYDSFERTHLPPHVTVCGKRYRILDALRGGRDAEGVELCQQDRDLIPDHLQQAPRESATQARVDPPPPPPPRCVASRASCRKWVALRDRRATSHTIARQGSGKATRIR